MPEFRLNLIRTQVPRPQDRRIRYLGMLAYLAVSGAFLVAALSFSTTCLVRATETRTDLRRLERQFAERHPAAGGIVPYAGGLESSLTRRIGALTTLDHQLAGRPRPAALLYHFVLSLPQGVSMRLLQLDASARTLTFELAASGARPEGDLGPSDLIARWSQNPALAVQMSEVTYLGSQRQPRGDSADVVWRFSARLRPKGS